MADQTMGQVYRSYAAKEQAYADEATLPMVRHVHTAAARKWIQLAERSEGFKKTT